jgi:membrane protein required for beta-lactamase induction
MTLISVLLGLAADRLLTHLHEYRHYRFFFSYVDWMRERFSGPAWDHVGGLLLILVPVWLAVGLIQQWVGDWLFGLVGLLFYTVVLAYCIGPRDLAFDADTYCEVCESTDPGLRARAAGRFLHSEDVPDDTAECARRVSNAVLVEANDRMFSVVFWFVLLGPLGAVLYRSASLLYQDRRDEGEFGDSVAWLHAILVWLPARLTALGYALSGHFDAALEAWRKTHQSPPRGSEGSRQVLAATAAGALGLEQEVLDDGDDVRAPVRAAMRLVWRTLTIWLVILAVLTLAGWAA